MRGYPDMPAMGYIVAANALLIFFVFGVAASIATVRRLVEVIRRGRFPRWDRKMDLSFSEAPISGGFYLLHLFLSLLAAVGCVVLPVWFVVKSG